jgi:hypothetical protein
MLEYDVKIYMLIMSHNGMASIKFTYCISLMCSPMGVCVCVCLFVSTQKTGKF